MNRSFFQLVGLLGLLLAAPAWADEPLAANGSFEVVHERSTGRLLLRDRSDRKIIRALSLNQEGGLVAVEAGALTPDGRIFAACVILQYPLNPNREMLFWNTASGKLVRQVRETEAFYSESLAFSPDGLLLASWDRNPSGGVHLWTTQGGQLLRTLKLETSAQVWGAVAFSPGGDRLLARPKGAPTQSWDLRDPLNETALPPAPLSGEAVAVLWADLGAENAPRAFRALGQLVACPDIAVPFLRNRLRAVPEVPAQRLTKLVGDLGSAVFADRDAATQELLTLSGLAEPALRDLLVTQASLEVRTRAATILESLDGRSFVAPPEERRAERAVRILEMIGTVQARAVLRTLADGAKWSPLTQRAKGALDRLEKATSR